MITNDSLDSVTRAQQGQRDVEGVGAAEGERLWLSRRQALRRRHECASCTSNQQRGVLHRGKGALFRLPKPRQNQNEQHHASYALHGTRDD